MVATVVFGTNRLLRGNPHKANATPTPRVSNQHRNQRNEESSTTQLNAATRLTVQGIAAQADGAFSRSNHKLGTAPLAKS